MMRQRSTACRTRVVATFAKAWMVVVRRWRPRPNPVRGFLVILSLLLFAPQRDSRLATAEQPNILFILTDDQGWTSLGCYGNELVPTPNLIVLRRKGCGSPMLMSCLNARPPARPC